MSRRGCLRLTMLAALAAVGFGSGVARADTRALSNDELERLERGDTIVREQTVTEGDDGERRMVGGLAYAIVDASPEELLGLLRAEDALLHLLPRMRAAKRLEGDGADQHVEITQGNALVAATYVAHVRAYPRENTVRFWLDPSYPHGIEDAWGFVRAEPLASSSGAPRSLVTYAALVDLGPGLVRTLFEARLRAAMLTVPTLLRAYVARVVPARRTPA